MEKEFLEADDRLNKKFDQVMKKLDEIEKEIVDLKNMMMLYIFKMDHGDQTYPALKLIIYL